MTADEDKAREILRKDAGDPVFAEYAEGLRRRREFGEAMMVCFNGLAQNPAHHKGRLVLARIHYELGQIPFAIREITELCRALPDSKSLKRLRDKLAPETAPAASPAAGTAEETVAEADFDFEELEMIEDDEDPSTE